MRRLAFAAGLALAVAGVHAASGVGDTGVSGTVESTVELTLDPSSAGRVDATATATVGPTRLSVTVPGHGPRVLRSFPGPVAYEHVTVREAATEQTITFGPQGP